MISIVPGRAREAGLRRDRPVQAHVQNVLAVLAVVLAIAMLGATLVVPHRSLLLPDTAALYADAG
jgi:hypothetical protein